MFGIALDVTNHASRFGLGPAARYAGWRVFNRIAGYMPYQGFVLPASRARSTASQPANGLLCREVQLAELREYAGDPAYDLSERFLSQARERSDCCVGVFAGERLVSYSFNATQATNIDSGFRYEFPEGWVYHFKALTLPEWRGQGLHGRQLPVIVRRFCGAAGFKGLTTLVLAANYPSLSSFRRLYFEAVFRFVIAGKGARRRVATFLRTPGLDEGFAVTTTGRA